MMENPYRLLDYYRYEDAPFFFGREEETAKMVGEILSTRLLVLFSPSGSGKTSLIKAGVQPELEKMGYLTIYNRMEGEPAVGVCKATAEVLGLEKKEPSQGQGLYDFLKQAVQDTGKPLVIFLDQFEEFFIVFKDNDTLRREFIQEVVKIKYDEQLPVFLVLSLREDYFAHLHEFRSEIPSIFNNNANIRLGLVTEKAVRRVLEEPVKQVGWKLEEGLADRVLADLKGLKKGGTAIEPMTLQLVCGTLWQERGQVEKKVIGQEVYYACGGAEKILTRYLHDRLAKVPPRQQGLMMKVFEALKTPDNTKRYRSLEDLHNQLRIKNRKRFSALLGVLAKEGILREEEKGETCWYEFKHDLLVPEINDWITARKERRRRRCFIYGIMSGIILFLILAVYFFIEYNTFYAILSERHYPEQEQELVIIRGFNPFNERIETGFFKSDLYDLAVKNKLNPRYKIGSWNDWTELENVLTFDNYVRLLIHLGEEEKAFEICMQGLKDNDSYFRSVAAGALIQLEKADDEILKALITALNDKECKVRYQAACALGKLGKSEPVVIQALMAALKNKYSCGQSAAVEALGKLGKADDEVVQALLAALKDDELYVRLAAVEALGNLGKADDKVVQALLVELKDFNLKSAAARSLGQLGKADNEVVQALLTTLQHPDGHVRSTVAKALGQLGKAAPSVIKALIAALKDKEVDFRSRATELLGQLGKEDLSATKTSIAKLKEQEVNLRSGAAEALGQLGNEDSDVINALLAALKDNELEVRYAAAYALGKLGKAEPDVIQVLKNMLKIRYFRNVVVAKALVQLGKADDDVVQYLLASLKDDSDFDRHTSAEALGQLEKTDDEVIQALIEALKDKESGSGFYGVNVREQAAEALGKLFRDKPEEELISYLRETRSAWRIIGAYALAAKGKASLSPKTLREIDLLKDNDPRPWVRLGAWLAFEKLKEKKEVP